MKSLFCNLLFFFALFSVAAAPGDYVFAVRHPFNAPKPSGNFRITPENTLLMDGKTSEITIKMTNYRIRKKEFPY